MKCVLRRSRWINQHSPCRTPNGEEHCCGLQCAGKFPSLAKISALIRGFCGDDRGIAICRLPVMTSRWDHPFHLHGFFFQVIDEKGLPVRPLAWKDTVNIPMKTTARLLVKFDERPGEWMFHCHILDHADGGLMGTCWWARSRRRATCTRSSPDRVSSQLRRRVSAYDSRHTSPREVPLPWPEARTPSEEGGRV